MHRLMWCRYFLVNWKYLLHECIKNVFTYSCQLEQLMFSLGGIFFFLDMQVCGK